MKFVSKETLDFSRWVSTMKRFNGKGVHKSRTYHKNVYVYNNLNGNLYIICDSELGFRKVSQEELDYLPDYDTVVSEMLFDSQYINNRCAELCRKFDPFAFLWLLKSILY